MRLLPAVLLALALAGCDSFLAEPGPRVGEVAPGGQGIVVGHGQLDGAEFLATATRRGNDVCVSLRVAGIPQRDGESCTQVMAGGQATSSLGWSSGTGSATIIEGFVSENAVRVQVSTSEGVLDAPTASLMALGVPGNAFSLAFSERVVLRWLVLLDSAGNEVERTDLGPGPGEPPPNVPVPH